jgi:hypothetical protein
MSLPEIIDCLNFKDILIILLSIKMLNKQKNPQIN